MQDTYYQILSELINEQNLVCGLAASPEGIEYARVGDFEAIEHKGLINTLIYDNETISRLNSSIEGQNLPQMWSQGRVTAYILKPENEVLIVLFSQDDKDAISKYQHSKIIDSSLSGKLERKTAK